MSGWRLLALGVLALTALGAALASTASASFTTTEIECKEAIPTLCLESNGKLFEAKGTETYSGKLVPGTEASLKSTIGEEEINVACTADASSGEIDQTEPLLKAVRSIKGVLKFSGCSLLGVLAKKCKVPATLTTTLLLGTVIDEMPINAGLVKPETGTTIIELALENNGAETCPATVKGTKRVAGEDLCTSAESEVDKVVHSGECVAAGSKLTFGEQPATFTCKAEVELSGGSKGKAWDVALG